jgi:hypothetical protein
LDTVLDQESTKYRNIDKDSCLLALKPTVHGLCYNAVKQMLWHHYLAHVGLKAL